MAGVTQAEKGAAGASPGWIVSTTLSICEVSLEETQTAKDCALQIVCQAPLYDSGL